MSCPNEYCNQGRCECPPVFLLSDKAFLYLEGLLFLVILSMALMTWRMW